MALNKAVSLEGYPMSFIRGLSYEFYRRVVQRMLSEGCPMNVIGGLYNEFYQKLVQ